MKKKMDTTRVQVTLSNDMLARIDALAEKYGVNRSAFLAIIIGQTVTSTEKAFESFSNLSDSLFRKVSEEVEK